jgi:peroxiredoxin
VILGASFDPPEANRAFRDKFNYPFQLLTFDKAQGEAYGVIDVTDPDYPLRNSYLIGPDRYVVKAYESVSPATHPAQVLADVPG